MTAIIESRDHRAWRIRMAKVLARMPRDERPGMRLAVERMLAQVARRKREETMI